jgi:transposase
LVTAKASRIGNFDVRAPGLKHTTKYLEKIMATKPVHPKVVRFHNGLHQLRRDAAGIDVGSREIWVDVGGENDPDPVRRFETFTESLTAMAEWLRGCGITTVAMESTSVYWMPPADILEAHGIQVLLVNPKYAKNVSGRKSDMLDCQWLRTLHCYGLLAASFRLPAHRAAFRSYMRQRLRLVEFAASHIQHISKALTQMNVQIQHVLSDITGVTGQRIIRAIIAGERDRKKLAALRDTRTKASQETIEKALQGDYRPAHLFALQQAVEGFDFYQKQIAACDQQIQAELARMETQNADPCKPARRAKRNRRNALPFDARQEACRISGVDLTQIDGINEAAALGLLAEIGVSVTAWKTEKHFASWLALCPNNRSSAGRILKRSTRAAATRGRSILCLCAQSLIRSQSALGAFCRRMCARLGEPKGIVATAHKLALLVYRMLSCGKDYVDIGQQRYNEQFKERVLRSLTRKAKDLGFELVRATAPPEPVVP